MMMEDQVNFELVGDAKEVVVVVAVVMVIVG